MSAINKVINITSHFYTAKELLKLAYKNDDMMQQEDLFELQQKLAMFVIELAEDLDKDDELVEEFPWLFR